MKEKYILVYKLGDNVEFEKGTVDFIKNKIEKLGLRSNEYGIIEGKIIKSFSATKGLINLTN